ncbi:MAG TPA: SprT family zinc-dependent metalloprotease [Candidatus Nitrosocosmicus sp.]|nr:SprT family zinc-dependent metalloprotease [Candidatus Nitrosocosmicus sp.]
MTEFLHFSPRMSGSRHLITHNNKVLEFHVIRSYRRKKTSEISIVNGSVCLRVPMTTTIQSIESLITRKANWILKRVYEQNNPDITIKEPTYSNNSTLPYLGKNCPLKIVECNYPSLRFSNDQFIIFTKKINIKRFYEQWLYRVAMSIFDPLIEKYSQILNVTPKKVLLKKLKSRWGSATYNNTINLNIHLIKAPLDVIEYVILHELSHLIERNHSPRFWKLVSKNMADYKTKRRWLRINGPYIL